MPIRPDQRYTPATRGSFSTVVSTLEYVPNGPGSLCQPNAAAGSLRSSRGGLQLFRVAEPGVEDWEREAVITADGENDTPRLAAVVERQRHELAAARAQAAVAAVVAMARGVLMERHQCSAAEAAGQLADMAAAAGLPLAEMAAAVLRQDPPPPEPAQEPPPGRRLEPHDPVTAARSERARDGMELVGALAGQLRPPFGVAAAAVWLLESDASLEMLGHAGLGGTEASRWRRLPPQFDCPQQRVAAAGRALWLHAGSPAGDPAPALVPWGRDAARAVLPLRDRAGVLLGVVEAWWATPRAGFSTDMRARMSAAVAGFAEVLGLRLAHSPIGAFAPSPALFTALDEVAGSALLVRPLRDAAGNVADFAILHVSPGYVDPAGRPAREVAGLTLLEAYPASMSGDGLFARADRILASGHAEHVPGAVTAPLTGARDAVEVGDLHAAPFFDGVLFTWRATGEPGRLAELLGHAQRLGQMGAWEENLTTGAVRWTESAFALFGLDPRSVAPIAIADLHNFVIAADRGPVRRFREALLRQGEPAATVFRIVRPGDTVVRQIRVFAEPVLGGGQVVALRGAFQDVSAQYHTQVALAATRDQLADVAHRAAEEHELAIRLQRAIMPPDAPPVEAAGVEVAVRYRPAEAGHLVAGDWYDALLLPGKDLLVVVGDITGHGIDAVTGMIAARNALRGLVATGAGPAELLRHLNYAACHLTEGLAGTVVCGRYDPETRVLRWARAGHLPPILVRDGTAETLPLPGGVLLGMDPDAEYEEAVLQMRGGDALLLFTDGLIERRAASISDALRELSAAAVPAGPDAASQADRILSSAASDTGDDACLVALRILLASVLPGPAGLPRPRRPRPRRPRPGRPATAPPATARPACHGPACHGPAGLPRPRRRLRCGSRFWRGAMRPGRAESFWGGGPQPQKERGGGPPPRTSRRRRVGGTGLRA
jgi:serine phosphatase RsbU (regulator of sigma subunit)